ncbi:MAG: hypothetical protein K1X74_11740 [Pirellulales bacterium]|nr:hypothetical protein [Pirellulales bacterium]
MPPRWIGCFAIVACTICGGCGPRAEAQRYARLVVEQYGGLHGLETTPNPRLRAEFARVIREGGTPRLLCRPGIPDAENAASVLAGLFELQHVDARLDETAALLPPGPLNLGPIDLARVESLLKRHAAVHRVWRTAWQRPQCEFGLLHTAGAFADVSFISQIRAGARLELLQGLVHADQDRLDKAIESIGYLFRAAAALAAERHVVARLEAAELRDETLRLVEHVVQHRAATSEQLGLLRDWLGKQLAAWTPDAEAWIGDRALGMHSYEVIRGGELLKLLTESDLALLAERRELEHFPQAALKQLDEDERFYLEAMRVLIGACRQPYFAREAAFKALQTRLTQLERTPQYPLVAARLLLPGIEEAQRLQARDRAACVAWHVTLAAAVAGAPVEPSPTDRLNPLSGQPWCVTSTGGQAYIDAIGAPLDPWPRPVVVPLHPASAAATATRPPPQRK